MAIDRTNLNALVDDSGSGTDGSIISKSTLASVIFDQVDKLIDGTSQVTSLQFPATQVASSNANTLDDYEEGSWTPVIGGSGGTSGQTYVANGQVGRYIKVGKMVHAHCYAALSAKGTITGNVEIQGLPFAAENITNMYTVVGGVWWRGLATSYVHVTGYISPGGQVVNMRAITAAATDSDTALATANINNNSEFMISFTYRASA